MTEPHTRTHLASTSYKSVITADPSTHIRAITVGLFIELIMFNPRYSNRPLFDFHLEMRYIQRPPVFAFSICSQTGCGQKESDAASD